MTKRDIIWNMVRMGSNLKVPIGIRILCKGIARRLSLNVMTKKEAAQWAGTISEYQKVPVDHRNWCRDFFMREGR